MSSKRVRRTVMLVLFLGGPITGWLLREDRGFLFGLVVSLLAVVWFLLEEKKIV